MDILYNKQAAYDYEILQTWEAGVVLRGPEVKSVKNKKVDFKGSYISLRDKAAWLVGLHIAPYKPAAAVQKNYEPKKERKLLLTKKELNQIKGKLSQKGLTVVPLKLYTTRSLVKLEIALVKGKKKYQKKEKIKKRDLNREIQRTLKDF